jgi:hypothetical protein
MMKTRPDCMWVAKQLFTVQVLAEIRSISRSGHPDKLAGHLRCQRCVHHRGGLVDVVAPDDQPFVPGPDHADQAHADPAHIGAGLHDPVKHAGPVSDITRQVGAEEDVHRPADAHLAFERQAGVFGHEAVAAIGSHKDTSTGWSDPFPSAGRGRWW